MCDPAIQQTEACIKCLMASTLRKTGDIPFDEVFNLDAVKASVSFRLRQEKLPVYFAKSLGKRLYILGVNRDGNLVANTVDLDDFNTIVEDFTTTG